MRRFKGLEWKANYHWLCVCLSDAILRSPLQDRCNDDESAAARSAASAAAAAIESATSSPNGKDGDRWWRRAVTARMDNVKRAHVMLKLTDGRVRRIGRSTSYIMRGVKTIFQGLSAWSLLPFHGSSHHPSPCAADGLCMRRFLYVTANYNWLNHNCHVYICMYLPKRWQETPLQRRPSHSRSCARRSRPTTTLRTN